MNPMRKMERRDSTHTKYTICRGKYLYNRFAVSDDAEEESCIRFIHFSISYICKSIIPLLQSLNYIYFSFII